MRPVAQTYDHSTCKVETKEQVIEGLLWYQLWALPGLHKTLTSKINGTDWWVDCDSLLEISSVSYPFFFFFALGKIESLHLFKPQTIVKKNLTLINIK